jgi:hypothetical protein
MRFRIKLLAGALRIVLQEEWVNEFDALFNLKFAKEEPAGSI